MDGTLMHRQRRMIRGLRFRWDRLQHARSADCDALIENRDRTHQRFDQLRASAVAAHEAAWQKGITQWDVELEKRIALAERETLLAVQHERLQSRHLKKAFKKSKAAAEKELETKTSELKTQIEASKAAALKSREGIKAKLEHERQAIEERVWQAREWVGLKTGHAKIQNQPAPDAHPNEEIIRGMTELSSLSKAFETAKQSLHDSIHGMENHSTTRMLGSVWLMTLGPVLGVVAGYVGSLFSLSLPFVALTGVGTAMVVVSLLYLTTSPIIHRTIHRMFPVVLGNDRECTLLLMQGRRIAETNYQNELARLDNLQSQGLLQLHQSHDERQRALVETLRQELSNLEASCKSKRTQWAQARQSGFLEVNGQHEPKLNELRASQANHKQKIETDFSLAVKKLDDEFHESQIRSNQRWVDGCKQAASRMERAIHQLHSSYPNWESEDFRNGAWPRTSESIAWEIGRLRPVIGTIESDVGATKPLASIIPTLEIPDLGEWPVVFDLLTHGSLIVNADPTVMETSNALVRHSVLRAITSLPAGTLNVTIIDPEGLGKQFSWLMALADIDPALVNHRVWTQPTHISDQLAHTARHVEDVIQQSLRNKYRNLRDYNQDAGPMAVPYRLIVWSHFPFGLDDHSWQSLCSIMSSGARCGVGVILQISSTHVWPSFANPKKLAEFGLRCNLTSDPSPSGMTKQTSGAIVRLEQPDLESFAMQPTLPPDDGAIQTIMEHHIEEVSQVGKCVVPFESIAPATDQIQAAESFDGLSIPIGISDAGRAQSLRLGSGTAQHVLIAGKTGSGKSSLLHTMISSAALKYSPNQLRMVLLDFKKGVEFQVYAEVALSHADIIGIESKREFGVSTLEYLDRVLHARGEAFRQWGVQDLPSLARKAPQVTMPRILILIDEFQELFVEDDKLSQQASMLMDRIVRQGRSFGMHLVLASQTLGGAYSLPRTTLAQMAVRIALQCDSSDAMLILSEDNTAAERLRHSGQAIYNESGGRIESNQGFQVAYIEKSIQLSHLNALPDSPVPHDATINALGRRIVFEGHKPAIWDPQSLKLAMQAQPSLEVGAIPMILGESVSIDPPVIKSLTRAAGRNVMVVGSDEDSVASLLAGTMAGFVQSQVSANGSDPSGLPQVLILDGSRGEDIHLRRLLGRVDTIPVSIQTVEIRGVETAMTKLQQELDRRLSDADGAHPSMLIAIVNLARFRELRRNEEFSYSSEPSGAKPDAVLANLLRDGPTVGMHCWIWADSVGTLSRWISRQSIRDIELRILMQMSANDSNQLIDSNVANKLDRYVALIQDDVEGKAIKFRPFELESVRFERA